MATRIRELSERVALQSLADAPVSGTGGLSSTYSTLFEAWAKVRAARSGRYVDDQQIDDAATHEFTIRYRSTWRAAKFLEWSGRRWRIVAGAEVEPRRWLMFSAVEEGVAS